MVANTPLSEAFIGIILLPIAGNAAEHITAMTVASKNKMDLAIGVSVGSSIQIALFVTPAVVLLGWSMERQMTLYFSLFETVTLVVAVGLVVVVMLNGRTNYLEGSLLCVCYIIVG
jgi:Ca2+:H+ antiporter